MEELTKTFMLNLKKHSMVNTKIFQRCRGAVLVYMHILSP